MNKDNLTRKARQKFPGKSWVVYKEGDARSGHHREIRIYIEVRAIFYSETFALTIQDKAPFN